MLTKNGGNVWNSKKKRPGDDQRHALGGWPHLRKQGDFRNVSEVESWPRLGVAYCRKNDTRNQNPDSFHHVGNKEGSSITSVGLPNPSVISEESKKSSTKSESNECKSSANVKPMISVTTSDPIQSNLKPSFENSDNVSLSSKEEKILAFKKLNKEKKEQLRAQKQRKKEDDKLRKMLGPKGLKVTVIDNVVFSKFCDQGEDRSLPQDTLRKSENEVKLDSSAFPELRTSSGNFSTKYNSSPPKNTTEIKNTSVAFGDSKSTELSDKGNNERTLDRNPPRSTKSRKRRDPVMVDIWKAIEVCQSGKKLEEEELAEEDLTQISQVIKPKEKEKCKIAGNILDSSNPLRHRGKKREIPKKSNPSRLKKAILAERKLRRDARNCSSKRVIAKNIIVKESKCIDFSNETPVLMPDKNVSCHPVDVSPRSEFLGNANELKDVESGKNMEKCLLEQLKDVSNTVDVDKMTKDALHSRNFREYCNHSKNADLSENVKLMLKDILKFQDRLYATQPIKAESHRRYVVGLRQTQHLLAVKKLKIIVMAHDLEKVPSPGGLDDIVNSIIDSANKLCVPVVFPLTRRQLGKATYRKVGVSCVGVLNYQGSEENYKKVMSSLEYSIKDYKDKFEKEKYRIMSELGILPTKEEDCKGTIKQEQQQKKPVDLALTLPLYEKLAEALSELSISASQRAEKEDLCD